MPYGLLLSVDAHIHLQLSGKHIGLPSKWLLVGSFPGRNSTFSLTRLASSDPVFSRYHTGERVDTCLSTRTAASDRLQLV